jgi:hypothetical protein
MNSPGNNKTVDVAENETYLSIEYVRDATTA